MQPQVRNLQSLIAEQNQALKPQYDLIQSDIAANAKAGQAQETGLEAKKDTAFSDITQQSQNKNMFFSGFTPDEQAKYTSGTYLPALAQLQATIAQTRSNLLGKKADLGKTAFDTAFGAREDDRAVLADWNRLSKQQQFTASQAEKNRAFQASERVASQQFSAGQNAQDRASSSDEPKLTKNQSGGWNVSGGLDLAGYARATGSDLIALLSQGDEKDKKAAQYYRDNIDLGRGEEYAMNRLKYYDRPTAFYRGG